MNGPSEFHVTGTLRDWDIVHRLAEIDIATLVVTGEHDEATPAINQTLSQGILLSPSYFRTPRTWLTWSTLLRTSPCLMTS
jgi:hypothetical protein